jgi:hypothetical protein
MLTLTPPTTRNFSEVSHTVSRGASTVYRRKSVRRRTREMRA